MPRHGRAALLRLATWIEEAEPDRADALATAAFALHPARHLEGRVDDSVAATTSWWQAEADRSTVTEHPGARPPEPVRDHRAQQARLRDAAESSAHWRRAGAEQIRGLLAEATGDQARLDLSGAGMEVLMELLTAALGSGDASRRPTSAGDLEFGLRLHVQASPGAEVTIRGEGGDLTLEGLRLRVTSYEEHTVATPRSTPVEPHPLDAEAPRSAPHPLDPGAPAPVGYSEPHPLDASTPYSRDQNPRDQHPRHPYAQDPHSPDPSTPEGLAPWDPHPQDPQPREPQPQNASGPEDLPPPSGPPVSTEDTPVDEATHTDTLPGPDPDVETTGPIDISTHAPWTRRWG